MFWYKTNKDVYVELTYPYCEFEIIHSDITNFNVKVAICYLNLAFESMPEKNYF